MEHNEVSFISLISAHINNEKRILPYPIDWLHIQRLGKIHSVSGILYLSMQEQAAIVNLPDNICDQLKQDFISTIYRSALQEQEMTRILKVFNQEKIKHLLFKGYLLKNLYPVPEMRTMGDIDILFSPTDRHRTHILLKAMGFKALLTYGNVWTYVKGIIRLEIHDQLIVRNFNQKVDYINYYKNVWSYAVSKDNSYTYEFANNDHLIYLIVHMAKHFYSTGCGIRMFIDIAVFIKHYGDQLDWSYIHSKLVELNLDVFARHILSFCVKWFNIIHPMPDVKLEEQFYKQVSEYILVAGVFGYYERNQHSGVLRSLGITKQKKKPLSMFYIYKAILFPSYDILSHHPGYAFLKNKRYMLPLAWILRGLRSLLLRGKHTLAILIGIKLSSKEFKEQGVMLDKLGL